MKLYIFNRETMKVIATVEGDRNIDCERIAEENGSCPDETVGWTYSPGFGFEGGLEENDKVVEL